MNTFEIFLLKNTDEPIHAARILDVLQEIGCAQALRSDPSRWLYRNHDTSVFFYFTLAPEIVALWKSRYLHAEDSGDEEAGKRFPVPLGIEEEEPMDAAGDEGEDENGEDASFHIEMPPVAIAVPLLWPLFFGREALALAVRLAEAAQLHVDHFEPAEETGEGQGERSLSPDGILSLLERENRKLLSTLKDRSGVTHWGPRKADEWWRYGLGRLRLIADLEKDRVHVPVLQAALHEGKVKSICEWQLGTPTVLPRVDLVIIRRVREKRGLLGSRSVLEEGLVSGERLWNLLEPFSELRTEPAEILVFRDPPKPPDRAARELEGLDLEPLKKARRTELAGVIDFEVEVR